jgi:methionine-rich copper-binding protein CopC
VSITRRTTARLLLGVLVAAVGTVAAVLGAATPASAHGQFVSSDPAKDSTVSMPLATIVVYFTEKPTSNAFFSVTAPSGARVDRLWSHGSTRHLDEPVHEYYHNTDGNWETRRYDTAYSALIPIAYWPEAGVYKVSFVSVATDGEPVRGEFSFTYDGALSPAPPDFRPQKNEPDPNLLAVVKTDQPTAPPSAGPEQGRPGPPRTPARACGSCWSGGAGAHRGRRDLRVLALRPDAARSILVSALRRPVRAGPAAAQAAALPQGDPGQAAGIKRR